MSVMQSVQLRNAQVNRVDVSNLSTGLYLVHVASENYIMIKKLVIK
ncbi:MAG: T9SS type A sorting domain-containing protein [Flavobacteriales bacterium]|nr:T9SS type A sorting domain-containing protein [Flavobacteriales bacterium]